MKLEISKLEINSLFERFNYKLDFNRGNICILTAPNGYGKSTILSIIDNLIKSDFMFFINLKFKEIKFTFSNRKEIKIEKTTYKHKSPSIKFYIDEQEQFTVDSMFFYELNNLDSDLPIFKKDEEVYNLWTSFDGDDLSLRDVLYRFRTNYRVESLYNKTKDFFDITKKIRVLYISTNRLFYRKRYDDSDNLTIFEVQEDIKYQIQQSLNEYMNEGRKKESSFPDRALKSIKEGSVNIENMNKLIRNIRSIENKLHEIGMQDGLSSSEDDITTLLSNVSDQSGLKVFNIYLDDKLAKLNKLTPLLDKISLFKNTLDNLLSFKHIQISLLKGFEIVTNDRKQVIPLSQLSSGEQHLILFIGKLIFSVERDSLILIDEPEISFHYSWQMEFVKIVSNIIRINEISLILATHAFPLVNEYWDSTIELAEQYDKKG
ncbi:AAA family ATPase [Actinobacillus equuli]|uniref:AAA family ATPase n=1 Tax=Actinobacillus equuli TaxID=718 RepID=UPI002442280A|nr:AAA family ATPase [Actinobacillus equuli]WGE65097.1 AAA family ATPase [Actinobacillus equuli subsp. equuli]WGE79080.1 AAA family ATPase [Actinobacillus equuli subsp. equuli]